MDVPIVIPALGEGIREVRVLRLLKPGGSRVVRDEPIAEIETDKAAFLIESPASGTLAEWHVETWGTYPVGFTMTTICNETAPPTPPATTRTEKRLRNATLSPRLRARAEQQSAIRIQTANIEMQVNWDALSASATACEHGTPEWIAFCTLQVMEHHRAFAAPATDHAGDTAGAPAIGLAVALRNDGLAIAPLQRANPAFGAAFRKAISQARSGNGAAARYSLVLSIMSSFGVRSAFPLVQPPAVATLFVGEPFSWPVQDHAGAVCWQRQAKLVLAFDHNRINGAGAARFLRDLRARVTGKER